MAVLKIIWRSIVFVGTLIVTIADSKKRRASA